ncbi:MAG: ABC transporter substrate-binding protein, partial [Ruminococcaceae bacterium]|nr:ABC transporter substrate-binding protein [Oscillospiraceae bacterium]
MEVETISVRTRRIIFFSIVAFATCFAIFLGVFTVKKLLSGKKEPKLRQKVQLALLCPLTGDDAFYGEGAKVSAETALSHLSKSGVFKKFSIELMEPIDDQNLTSEATVSASMAVRLNPHVCIGHQKTQMTLVSAPLFEENKIPFISMSTGTAPVSNGWEYLHMGMPIYRDIEKTMADYLILERKIKSLAVVVADEYEFRDASRNFLSSIEKGKASVKQFKLFTNDEKFELKADEGEIEKQIEAIIFFGVDPENVTKVMELFRSFGGAFSKSPIIAFGIPSDIDKDY